MNKEQIPEGFKIALSEKEVYTYDKDSDKWKLGRREATREELSMIEFIVQQLDAPTAEQVSKADVDVSKDMKPADMVKSGKTLPRPTKALPKEAEPVESGKDKDIVTKKDILTALKEDREQSKGKKDQAKPESLLEEQKRSKAPLLVKIQNVSEVAKAIVDTLQRSAKVNPPQVPSQRRDEEPRADDALTSNFKKRMREKNPWLRLITDMMETPEDRAKGKTPKRSLFGRVYGKNGAAAPVTPEVSGGRRASPMTQDATDGQKRMAEKLGANKAKPSDFTPKFGGRPELNRLSDLTEGEKELLARRGIAPASEKDFSYRKEGKPLSKAQLLEELDLAHDEGPLKSGFKKRMREKNPWLRLVTNKMETPEDIAKGKTPKAAISTAFRSTKAATKNVAEKVAESNVFKKASGFFGKAAGKTATKAAAKADSKALGKYLLKKIPGVGLIAGLGFGAGRLMSGDWKGALGEVASGAASTIPLAGTALSAAIDVGLASRDMRAEREKEQPQMFAKGGVVEGATPFKHSGGTGIMGEAGAEAIMPLKRDSSGNLGVSAEPVSKDALTNQTTSLKQTDEELKKREAITQTQEPAPTIINSSTINNTMGGGGSESRVTAASPRGSLATNYFAF